jgi:hypothetical protein
VREMRAQGVDWFELWPDDRLIPIVDVNEVRPWFYWGPENEPDRRFPLPGHPDGVPIVAGLPRDPCRL